MKLKDNYPDRARIWCCKSDIELITFCVGELISIGGAWNTVTMGKSI